MKKIDAATIEFTDEEIVALPIYQPNGMQIKSQFRIVNTDTLLKIFPNSSLSDIAIQKIESLTQLDLINCVYPKKLCSAHGKTKGYFMEFILGEKTWRTALKDTNLTIEDKINMIHNVFIPIKQLHQLGIIIGDIHLDNFIYRKEEKYEDCHYHGYLADIEDFYIPKLEDNCRQLYTISPNSYDEPYLLPTMQTDNIKATINCLSLIYGVNFQQYLEYYDYTLYQLLAILKEYVDEQLYPEIEKLFTETGYHNFIYFDELAPILLRCNSYCKQKGK